MRVRHCERLTLRIEPTGMENRAGCVQIREGEPVPVSERGLRLECRNESNGASGEWESRHPKLAVTGRVPEVPPSRDSGR